MLRKVSCEVCGLANPNILHRHHIIPRCDPRCTNHSGNLAILCPNDHSLVHSGKIIILGVYSSSAGRCLVWHYQNEEPPFPKQFWIVKENPFVVTLSGEQDDLPEE